MQGLGLLIFTSQIYFYYENEFGLSILTTSNGFYYFKTRLDNFSLNHAIGPIALFGYFLIIYFTMYSPSKTFVKVYESYKEYLS